MMCRFQGLAIKEDLFGFIQLYHKILECKGDLNKTIKFVCIAMCSLVMSLHSRDIATH